MGPSWENLNRSCQSSAGCVDRPVSPGEREYDGPCSRRPRRIGGAGSTFNDQEWRRRDWKDLLADG